MAVLQAGRAGTVPDLPPVTDLRNTTLTRTLSEEDFAVPPRDRYFEDYRPGAVYEYGYLTVTEAEIIEFARRFDPQPMHTNPEAAVRGQFGGLIASGWHTAGIFMRLYAAHYLSEVASLASPGIDELRWPVPLRPGDSVRLRTEILDARRSRSKPGRGIVHTRGRLINASDEDVMRLTAINIFRARTAAPPQPSSG